MIIRPTVLTTAFLAVVADIAFAEKDSQQRRLRTGVTKHSASTESLYMGAMPNEEFIWRSLQGGMSMTIDFPSTSPTESLVISKTDTPENVPTSSPVMTDSDFPTLLPTPSSSSDQDDDTLSQPTVATDDSFPEPTVLETAAPSNEFQEPSDMPSDMASDIPSLSPADFLFQR